MMRCYARRCLSVRPMLLLLIAALACGGDSTGPDQQDQQDGPARSVSGTVTLSAALASQAVVLGEIPGNTSARSGDTVTVIIPGTTIGSTITLAGGATSRTYEYQLPDDPATFGDLIAFIDLDGDGIPEPSTEPVRVAVKQIEGIDRVVDSWSFGGNPREYIVGNSAASFLWSIDLIGTTGFNFSF